MIGSRILRELRALGYDGHRSALCRYLEHLKAQAPSSKVTEGYETPPAQQAQFDWSPHTIELGGELMRVIVFGMVLGYSRRKHYTASLDETQAAPHTRRRQSVARWCTGTNGWAPAIDPNRSLFRGLSNSDPGPSEAALVAMAK